LRHAVAVDRLPGRQGLSMADLTLEPWSVFGPDALTEIAARAIPFGNDQVVDALQFAAGWATRVAKFDADRALAWTGRTWLKEHNTAARQNQEDFAQGPMST